MRVFVEDGSVRAVFIIAGTDTDGLQQRGSAATRVVDFPSSAGTPSQDPCLHLQTSSPYTRIPHHRT